jgi:hypothetical protein
MRTVIVAAALSSFLAVGTTAQADATPSGIELGLRSGYAIPFGAATGGATDGSNDMSKVVSGMVPIWVDAGYRLPSLYVGAFFQYGIGIVASGSQSVTGPCGQNGLSCSISDLMLGIDAHYHFAPEGVIDPYLGVGVGYEIFNFDDSAAGKSASVSINGVQFVNFQGGVDYKAMPNLGIGPFVMFSVDQFSGCSYGGVAASQGNCSIPQQAIHEWLTLGVRGAYDINLP